jgi:hypothetical protein
MNKELIRSIEQAEALILKLECDGKPISEVVMMLTSAISLIIVSNGDNITLNEKVRRCCEQLKTVTKFINEVNKDNL